MNRKGFTLIELIAVVVVMSIILVVVAPTVINVYESSKLKSEELFLNRLSQTIDSYTDLYSDELVFSPSGQGKKDNLNESGSYTVDVYKATKEINDVINSELLTGEDFLNPGNEDVKCNLNTEIEIYRDSEFVYCHKIKKNSLGCLTDKYKNSIGEYAIDTCIWEEVK